MHGRGQAIAPGLCDSRSDYRRSLASRRSRLDPPPSVMAAYGSRSFTLARRRPSGPNGKEGRMFTYRLHLADGSDVGEATYPRSRQGRRGVVLRRRPAPPRARRCGLRRRGRIVVRRVATGRSGVGAELAARHETVCIGWQSQPGCKAERYEHTRPAGSPRRVLDRADVSEELEQKSHHEGAHPYCSSSPVSTCLDNACDVVSEDIRGLSRHEPRRDQEALCK
jgi:hypothetical protein